MQAVGAAIAPTTDIRLRRRQPASHANNLYKMRSTEVGYPGLIDQSKNFRSSLNWATIGKGKTHAANRLVRALYDSRRFRRLFHWALN